MHMKTRRVELVLVVLYTIYTDNLGNCASMCTYMKSINYLIIMHIHVLLKQFMHVNYNNMQHARLLIG